MTAPHEVVRAVDPVEPDTVDALGPFGTRGAVLVVVGPGVVACADDDDVEHVE